MMTPFEPRIYKPHPEKPGYLKLERMATYRELFDFCKSNLKSSGVLDQLEYFDLSTSLRYERKATPDDPLPKNLRWIVVFAVTGGSEGFYIHVELITSNDDPKRGHDRLCVILGKDLSNKMDTALKAVNVLAPLLS